MPVMNGLEAAAAIRETAHRDAQSIPIIALSANAFEEDVEKDVYKRQIKKLIRTKRLLN